MKFGGNQSIMVFLIISERPSGVFFKVWEKAFCVFVSITNLVSLMNCIAFELSNRGVSGELAHGLGRNPRG